MALLLGDEFVLVVSRAADLRTHSINIVPSVEEAIAIWDWSTRISPIFSLDGARPPDLAGTHQIKFYFVGPVAPGKLPADVPAFLTFGTYNALLVVDTVEQQKSIDNFLEALPSVPWEYWVVENGHIQSWECSPNLQKPANATPVKPIKITTVGMRSAQDENSTLLAASIAKAQRYFPDNAIELEKFSQVFASKLLADRHNHETTKLSWLVNVNAHLSRYTSQTFSGTSPITQTECHFWTHSLLGVGLATQALTKIRRFVENSASKHDPVERLDNFKTTPPFRESLIQLRTTFDEGWSELAAVIADVKPQDNPSKNPVNQDRMPLIVCFSGRDGFRSTLFSLSVPLEVITCCNTYGWTPMTMTHEMCHVWVTGILGRLFPNLGTPATAQFLIDLADGKYKPKNLFEQIQQFLYFAFTLLYRENIGVSYTADDIPEDKQLTHVQIIESQNLAVNEILTHILDFQFFYQRDDELYVRSIWSSWDVIPNIKDRLTDYILRSACALLSDKLNQKNAIDIALDRLENLLEKVAKSIPDTQYLTEALRILKQDRESLKLRLRVRSYLVRIAYTFFVNQELAALLQRERPEAGGHYKSMKQKTFAPGESITNPLKFIAAFAQDKMNDRAKSIWMLQYLAFSDHVEPSA